MSSSLRFLSCTLLALWISATSACYELYKKDIWCGPPVERDLVGNPKTENYRSNKKKCQDWCNATATCKFYLFDQDSDCSLLANCDGQTNYIATDTSVVYKRGCSASTPTPTPAVPICVSTGGQPHLRAFGNAGFYGLPLTGWQTLYEKSGFKIQALQGRLLPERRFPNVNLAIRVWKNGKEVYEFSEGKLLSQDGWHMEANHSSSKEFVAAGVNLTVVRHSWLEDTRYYSVYIQTHQLSDASGWCLKKTGDTTTSTTTTTTITTPYKYKSIKSGTCESHAFLSSIESFDECKIAAKVTGMLDKDADGVVTNERGDHGTTRPYGCSVHTWNNVQFFGDNVGSSAVPIQDTNGWETLICRVTVTKIKSGTCESNGLSSIKSFDECKIAAEVTGMLDKDADGVVENVRGDHGTSRPFGCSAHKFNHLQFFGDNIGSIAVPIQDTNGWETLLCGVAAPPTPTPSAPKRLCSSVGDPHIHRFDGTTFDNHDLDWQTLYKCGGFEIQVEQSLWLTTGSNAAVSKAVRYKTSSQTSWVTLQGGSNLPDGTVQTLKDSRGVRVVGTAKTFTNPDVHLLVHVEDRRHQAGVREPFFYNVYITTSACPGATGQCVQPTRRLRRLDDTSGGVAFPSVDVKVSKADAEAACAGLKEQKQNCVTDVRMANDPSHTPLIKEDFARVEATVEWIDTEVIKRPEGPVTTESTKIPSVAVSTTTQCLSALVALVLLGL